jgi:hypothetical protein
MNSLEQKVDSLADILHRICDFLGLPTRPTPSCRPPSVNLTVDCPPAEDQFLGIDADAVDTIGIAHGDKQLTNKAMPSEHHMSATSQPEPKDASGPTVEGPPPSQAEPTSQSTITKNHKSLQELVLNTIYRDCRVREKHAKMLVVSGLHNTAGTYDSDIVADLFRFEFDFVPDIAYCRRLGEPITGRTQPLLVALVYSEDAAWLLANAKKLRKSKNIDTKESVYINPYLTPTEARAEFEARCQRRAKRSAERIKADRIALTNAERQDNAQSQRIRVIIGSGHGRITHEPRTHRDHSQVLTDSSATDEAAMEVGGLPPHTATTTTTTETTAASVLAPTVTQATCDVTGQSSRAGSGGAGRLPSAAIV